VSEGVDDALLASDSKAATQIDQQQQYRRRDERGDNSKRKWEAHVSELRFAELDEVQRYARHAVRLDSRYLIHLAGRLALHAVAAVYLPGQIGVTE
jgi:hypothetical protein